MDPLERQILERLAKAKQVQQTNIDLKAVWRDCAGVTSTAFGKAWSSLDAEELVHGELYATAETIEGLGKITAKGEEMLRE
jgi:hypothetical protein